MDRTFHPFPRLPAELREAIWRLCIPTQVCELDQPVAELVYEDIDGPDEAPCALGDTTRINFCPPLITQVCYESRAIALKAGKEAFEARNAALPDMPHDAWFSSGTTVTHFMTYNDRIPSVFYSNWAVCYGPQYGASFDQYAPIHNLAAWVAAPERAAISVDGLIGRFLWDIHDDSDYDSDDSFYEAETNPPLRPASPDTQRFIAAFKRLPSWLVVLQIVVIHTDFRTGAATGLFGLLGDAPIQIIDMEEVEKIDRFFELAKECENQSPVSVAQDLERRPLEVARKRLRDAIVLEYGSEELVPIMHPAIMFRLCTFMCNHLSQKRKGNTWRKRR